MRDPREVLTRPAEPGVTIPYGDHPDQVVELFQPETTPRATVVALHGGFWRQEFDRAHLRPFCHGLTAAGYAVVAPEYRRSGGDGGWPRTFDDVMAALELLDGELTDHDLAPDDVILTGHSAGGHLALLAATTDWARTTRTITPARVSGSGGAEPGRQRVRGVVALAPVSDLHRCHAEHLGDGAAAAFMGGGPGELPGEYAAADPMRHAVPVPVTVVHGDTDDRVPIAMSRDYAARDGVTLRTLTGYGHFEVIDPLAAPWPTILAAFGELAHQRN